MQNVDLKNKSCKKILVKNESEALTQKKFDFLIEFFLSSSSSF